MKGMVAPRLGAAQIPTGPVPITRNITVTDGVSVKDLAEKLDLRAKDLIATSVAARRVCDCQSVA